MTNPKAKSPTMSSTPKTPASPKEKSPSKPTMSHEVQVVNMMINRMDDLSVIRSGCSTLQDLGLSNPIDVWSQGDTLILAQKIRNELSGEAEGDILKEKYIILAKNMLNLSHAYKMYSNLADALIRIATIHAFETDYAS